MGPTQDGNLLLNIARRSKLPECTLGHFGEHLGHRIDANRRVLVEESEHLPAVGCELPSEECVEEYLDEDKMLLE